MIVVQFSSVAQSCPTLCDPMNRSMPGLPVHHHLPEFTQTMSRGSAGDYQADEQEGIPRLSWRVTGR